MSLSNAEALTLRRQLPGRRIFALKWTRERVDPEREVGLQELIDEAIACDRKVLPLLDRWEIVKKNPSKKRGEAVHFDNQIDRNLSSIHSILEGHINGPSTPKARRKAEAAQRIKTKVFPRGVGAITQLSYEEQHSRVTVLLKDLRGTLAGDVDCLSLTEHVDQLALLNDAFEAELAKHPDEISWPEVQAAMALGQEFYSGVILSILGRYPRPDEASRNRRDELLAEIYRQDQLLAEYYKRNRGAVDVNPDTGEPVEPGTQLPAVEPAA